MKTMKTHVTHSRQSKILVVDDEPVASSMVKQYLEKFDYTVETADDGVEALAKVEEFQPHCVLMDIRMPNLNGFDALKKIKLRKPQVKIIMTTALDNIKMAEECLRRGAFGYIPKPLDLDYLIKQIEAALEPRKARVDRESWDKLESLLDEGKATDLKTLLLREELFNALKLSADIIHYADPDLALHSKNVAWLAREIGEEMKFSHLLKAIETAALFHDIGKQSFPRRLRDVPFINLSSAEQALFCRFPVHGQDMLRSYFPLEGVGIIIRYQCENWDGTGFPDGLQKNDIPLPSRIIAVANAFDEMLGNNNYRNIEVDGVTWDCAQAIKKIKTDFENKFDASVVDALSQILKRHQSSPRAETVVKLDELKSGMILSRELASESGKVIFLRNTPLHHSRIKIIKEFDRIDPVTSIYIYQNA